MARKRRIAKSKKPKKINKFKPKNTFINENNNEISDLVAPEQDAREHTKVKDSIVAPNGKTFYPCQYCTKFFPRETTCKTHMDRCSSKNQLEAQNEQIQQNKAVKNCKLFSCEYCGKKFTSTRTHMKKCVNNVNSKSKINVTRQSVLSTSKKTESSEKGDDSDESINKSEILNTSGSSIENKNPQPIKKPPKINITQNITVKSASTVIQDSAAEEKVVDDDDDDDIQIIPQEIPKYDLSIYDYDEDTTNDAPRIENKCKWCPFIAENAIALIRHKRSEHSGPRKIIPANEIQKYFDWPDKNFCPICEKPIKSRNCRSLFIRHLLVHTMGLCYECKICKKKFRRTDHLRGHEKRHIITFDELQAIQNTVYEDDIALKQHINML